MPNGPSPPVFAWESWYAAVGGRSISFDEVDRYLRKIFEDQYPRFEGAVAAERHEFKSPAEASLHLKQKANEFGADIVGIAAIEPSDVYRGRTVSEKFAIAVGQRMRWREFQVVPSRESAIECLRVYFTLGETVIRLADHVRSLGYPCRVEHPIGDSDLLHIPIGLKAGFGELGRHGSIIHPELGPMFRILPPSLPGKPRAPLRLEALGISCEIIADDSRSHARQRARNVPSGDPRPRMCALGALCQKRPRLLLN